MNSYSPHADVLVYAEDPGAANFVADLPRTLAAKGYSTHFATGGSATAYLEQRGVDVKPLPPQSNLDAVLDAISPKLIVAGTAENPDSIGLMLIARAAVRRIPSVGAVDSSTNLDYRFRGRSTNPLTFCPELVIVPDTMAGDGLLKLGLGRDRIAIVGHPHWDYVRSASRSLSRLDREELRQRYFGDSASERTVVLFASEISDGMDTRQFQLSDEYTLGGQSKSRGRTEIVIEEFLSAAKSSRHRLHLVLKLHPKQSPRALSGYQREFDTVSQADSSLELIHAADAVVGMTSMMLTEAVLMRRPTLAILPRECETAWLPAIMLGVTPYACDHDSILEKFSSLLSCASLPDDETLENLFPSGALDNMTAACERFGLP